MQKGQIQQLCKAVSQSESMPIYKETYLLTGFGLFVIPMFIM